MFTQLIIDWHKVIKACMIQLHYSTRFYKIETQVWQIVFMIKNTNKSQFILKKKKKKKLKRKELVEDKLMVWWFLLQQHLVL